MEQSCAKLHVVAFGMGIGVTWALGLFIVGLLAVYTSTGVDMVNALGDLYVGFKPTLGGVFIGTVWALVDGFIGGAIIAFVYNYFAGKCCKVS